MRERVPFDARWISSTLLNFKLDDVKLAVQDFGVQGLTITEVQGFGRQRGTGPRGPA